MKFTKWVHEERTPDQKKAMALMDKVRGKIAKGARYNDVSADISNAIRLLKKGEKTSEETINEGEVMDMVKQIMSDLKTVIKLTAQERKTKAGFVKIDKELAKLINMMAAEKEKQKK